jgi:hypothetical protein
MVGDMILPPSTPAVSKQPGYVTGGRRAAHPPQVVAGIGFPAVGIPGQIP